MSSSAGYNNMTPTHGGGPYTNIHHNNNNNNNNNTDVSGGGGANHDNKIYDNSFLESANNGFQTHCGCLECYHPAAETLDYDYTAANANDGSSSSSKTPHPRIRERGEFYLDSFNDQPWSWSVGTNEMVCTVACDSCVCHVCAMCSALIA
jgi:hypothetical protein